MKRWMMVLPLAVLAIILGFSLSVLTSKNPSPTGFESPRRPAPTAQLAGFDGPPVAIPQFRGRPVLVNFWGSYCAPCKLEHPQLMNMQAAGVEIVGILYHDPNPDEARAYLVSHGNPFAHIAEDLEGRAFVDFGAAGVPESFLVDGDGVIIKSLRGPFDAAAAGAFIDAYNAEKAKAKPAAAS
jgi:cytochrome c biogenesis protein CcmG/thiol:disulfide interchange protein DsbE